MGFTQGTIDFLFENRLHDSREWFGEHKQDGRSINGIILYYHSAESFLYAAVRAVVAAAVTYSARSNRTEPLGELVTELAPIMAKIDKMIICDPKRISRIYRDARYAKDSVFRDEVWYPRTSPRGRL